MSETVSMEKAADKVTDYRSGKRCYTWRGYHIPGCIGCAVYGHDRCTCVSPNREEIIDKMTMLERRIAEMEGKL